MKNEGGLDADSKLDNSHSRFVLLRHALPPESGLPSHWDLMFEQEHSQNLLTLQLLQLPNITGDNTCKRTASGPFEIIPAKRIADHRPLYLDYEGPLSQDRGRVQRVAAGTYRVSNASQSLLHARYELQSPQLCAILVLDAPRRTGQVSIRVELWLAGQAR